MLPTRLLDRPSGPTKWDAAIADVSTSRHVFLFCGLRVRTETLGVLGQGLFPLIDVPITQGTGTQSHSSRMISHVLSIVSAERAYRSVGASFPSVPQDARECRHRRGRSDMESRRSQICLAVDLRVHPSFAKLFVTINANSISNFWNASIPTLSSSEDAPPQ